MEVNEFAKKYIEIKDCKVVTPTEAALRKAIANGDITPDMSLRKMGKVIGVNNPQKIRYYILRFLKEVTLQPNGDK